VASRDEPERTCVACLRKAPRRELLRVARTAQGVQVDVAAREPGRGAYVHRDAACVELALHKRGLARALRVVVAPEEAARLQADMERELGRP